MFSPTVIREIAESGRSSSFARLIREAQISELCGGGASVIDAFNAAFSVLCRNGCRDEYVYKSAIVKSMLLGRHSLNTASVLSQFRVRDSKADIVILNGTATVYEIKSDRDTLSRLARQVDNYSKVFARTYVLASDVHIDAVWREVPETIGVMSLGKRFRVSTEREAADLSDSVCPQSIFDSLRSSEARLVLEALNVVVPEVPNTLLHGAMREIFGELSPRIVHEAMVAVLKRSRNLAPMSALIEGLPHSLRAAALTADFRHTDPSRLMGALHERLDSALRWT